MTQFSPRSDPPIRFRATPGQQGQAAAMQALKSRRPPGPAPSGAQRQPRRRSADRQGTGSPLGLPQVPEQEPDNKHLVYALHHTNISGLGREMPFGIWSILNGHFRDMVPPGTVPYDWFE